MKHYGLLTNKKTAMNHLKNNTILAAIDWNLKELMKKLN